jgi:Beta-lactamase enzyme family
MSRRALLTVLALACALMAPPAAARAQEEPGSVVPSLDQIAQTKRFVKERKGRRAFAVVDSQGELAGLNVHARFVTASVVKAMLLVEYLRELDRAGRSLSRADRDVLTPMIRVSSNADATTIYRRVGDGGLRRLARDTGMEDFVIGPGYLKSCRCRAGLWARAQLSAADQARFFRDMDGYLPSQFRAFARNLLETVVADQSWGIPAAARPLGYRVFFKVGLRSTGLGALIHQSARLELNGQRIGVCVLTDGDPTYAYGKATVLGVGRLLVGPTGPIAR